MEGGSAASGGLSRAAFFETMMAGRASAELKKMSCQDHTVSLMFKLASTVNGKNMLLNERLVTGHCMEVVGPSLHFLNCL